VSQKTGLEEVYDRHNQQYGTQHYCMYLPKFHPELNPIERCWSRMKWYIRKYCDGKVEQLRKSMTYGLSEANLPTALIRRYTRIVSAYYIT
jgi:transposase